MNIDFAHSIFSLLIAFPSDDSNQFHDVIPGSSINEVYKDSTEHYNYVLQQSGKNLFQQTLQAMLAKGGDNNNTQSTVAVNTLGWPRTEIVELPSTSLSIIHLSLIFQPSL